MRITMAEYKNGVNFRGNMSVEADDISPDIKTGRIVFVDDDLYESDAVYKAKVDKCVEEGFVKSSDIGSGGSGGGGGAEPLIVNVTYDDDGNRFLMDKTFGEIRQAFNNGIAVVIVQTETEGTSTDLAMWSVYKCGYSIIGGEYPSATGEVTGSFGSYGVACSEAPYTLEALDAQYPSLAD